MPVIALARSDATNAATSASPEPHQPSRMPEASAAVELLQAIPVEAARDSKKRCRDPDADLVEEAGVQEMLVVSAPWTADGLPAGGGLGPGHGALDAVVTKWTVESGRGHPSGTSWVKKNAGPHAWLPPQPPATSNVRRPVSTAPSSEVRAADCSALGSDIRNVMGSDPPVLISTSPELEVPVEHLGHSVVGIGDEAVEPHGHDGDHA